MAAVKVLTRDADGKLTPTNGTMVVVGSEKIDRVKSVELIGKPNSSWILRIDVHVDPAQTFEVIP